MVCEGFDGEDFSFLESTYFISDALLDFLEVSGSKYLEKVEDRLSLIQKDNVTCVISRVEKRIGCRIPKKVRLYIHDCFSDIVIETKEVIQKYKENLRINR